MNKHLRTELSNILRVLPRLQHKIINKHRVKLADRTSHIEILRNIRLEILSCLQEIIKVNLCKSDQRDVKAFIDEILF